jgi:hypothetical protein
MDMFRGQKGLFSQIVWFDKSWILIMGIRVAFDVANNFNIISHKAIF